VSDAIGRDSSRKCSNKITVRYAENKNRVTIHNGVSRIFHCGSRDRRPRPGCGSWEGQHTPSPLRRRLLENERVNLIIIIIIVIIIPVPAAARGTAEGECGLSSTLTAS